MEKTIQRVLLIMIITGALFTYGCFNDDLFDADTDSCVKDEDSEEADIEVNADVSVEVEATVKIGGPDSVVEKGGGTSSEATSEPTPAPAPTPEPTPVEEPIPVEESIPVEEEQSVYKDGSYSAQGSYFNPAGGDSIGVTLMIDNDIVTSVTVTPNTTNETTKAFQERFRDGIGALVIDELADSIGDFSVVNGSSLTPNGFANAFATIKMSAKN